MKRVETRKKAGRTRKRIVVLGMDEDRGGKRGGGGKVWMIFFFQAEDGIRDRLVTGVQTCALPISVGRTGDDAASFQGRTQQT